MNNFSSAEKFGDINGNTDSNLLRATLERLERKMLSDPSLEENDFQEFIEIGKSIKQLYETNPNNENECLYMNFRHLQREYIKHLSVLERNSILVANSQLLDMADTWSGIEIGYERLRALLSFPRFSEKAISYIFRSSPNNIKNLALIVEFGDYTEKVRARSLISDLLREDISSEDLIYAVGFGDRMSAENAWDLLDKDSLTDDHLKLLVSFDRWEYSLNAMKLLWERNPSVLNAEFFIENCNLNLDFVKSIIINMLIKDVIPQSLFYIIWNSQWVKNNEVLDALGKSAPRLENLEKSNLFLFYNADTLNSDIKKSLGKELLSRFENDLTNQELFAIFHEYGVEEASIHLRRLNPDDGYYLLTGLVDEGFHSFQWEEMISAHANNKQFFENAISFCRFNKCNPILQNKLFNYVLDQFGNNDYQLVDLIATISQDISIRNKAVEIALTNIPENLSFAFIVSNFGNTEQKNELLTILTNLDNIPEHQLINILKCASSLGDLKSPEIIKIIDDIISSTTSVSFLMSIIDFLEGKLHRKVVDKITSLCFETQDFTSLLNLLKKLDDKNVNKRICLEMVRHNIDVDSIIRALFFVDNLHTDQILHHVFDQQLTNSNLLLLWVRFPNLKSKLLNLVLNNPQDSDFFIFIRLLKDSPDLQKKLIDSLSQNDKEHFYESKHQNEKENPSVPSIIPSLLLSSWKPEDLPYMLTKFANQITVSFEDFFVVYSDPSIQTFFSENDTKLTYANSFSIAIAVVRYVESHFSGIFSADNIKHSLEEILRFRADFENLDILSSSRSLILFTHEEETFDNKIISRFAKRCGVERIVDENFKGKESKNNILDSITQSNGPTTIWFSGHGGPTSLGLAEDPVYIESAGLIQHPWAINYEEIGEALIKSNNIENIILVLDTCYSYDFAKNLFDYLKRNGIEQMPKIISSANKNRVSISGPLSIIHTDDFSLSNSQFVDPLLFEDLRDGLKGSHLIKGESLNYDWIDPAFFMNYENSYIEVSEGLQIEESKNA
jgi:hypothetical protein